MKCKAFWILPLVALLWLGLAVPPVNAAAVPDNITLSAGVSPQSLSAAGTVTLTLSLSKNLTDAYAMESVKLYRGATLLQNLDNVEPGNTRTFTVPLPVAADDLGKDITLTLKWVEGVQNLSGDFTIKVNKIAAGEPQIDFTRRVSIQKVTQGDKVVLTYTVRNTGDTSVSQLAVTDSAVDVEKTKKTLASGDEWTFAEEITVNQAFNTRPTLTYSANGQSYTRTLDSVAVTLGVPALKVELAIDSTVLQQGDEFTLTSTVTNTGDVDFKNVTVTDESGLFAATVKDLLAGQTRQLTGWKMTAQQDKTFTVTATGTTAGGTEVEALSNTVSMTLGNPTVALAISATVDQALLTAPGTVTVNLRVDNNGTGILKDLVITDAQGRQIQAVDALPMGTAYITTQVEITETTQLVYTVSVLLDDGSAATASSEPVEVKVEIPPTPVPTPEETAAPEVSDVPAAAGALPEGFTTLLIILAVVVVLAFVVGMLLARENRKHTRKSRGARHAGRR